MSGQLPEEVAELLRKCDSVVVVGAGDGGAMYAELARDKRLSPGELSEMADVIIEREAARRGCTAFEARWR